MILAAIDTWTVIGWILISGLTGWTAHQILPEWWNGRRARKERCATLDAYWSHEITAQEAAKRLAETGR